MNKREAIETLKENARCVSTKYKKDVLSWPYIVRADSGGEGYIPGYIPYIGEEYFSAKPRILIYALSQNIKSSDSFAKDWAEPTNIEQALDRQNISFEKKGIIEMYPFDTGHLPVIAAMLLEQVGIRANKLSGICNLVSATNLSKFSFRKNRGRNTADNKESLEKCFDRFSKLEIEVLQPNYIICSGDLVFDVIEHNVIPSNDTKITKVAFPSLQVINRWHKEYQDFTVHKTKYDILNMLPNNELKRNVAYKNKTLTDVIERDFIYFSNMYSEIERQRCKKCSHRL